MEDDSVQAIYVMNYGNRAAAPYGRFEDFGAIPLVAVLDGYRMSLPGGGAERSGLRLFIRCARSQPGKVRKLKIG